MVEWDTAEMWRDLENCDEERGSSRVDYVVYSPPDGVTATRVLAGSLPSQPVTTSTTTTTLRCRSLYNVDQTRH